MDTKQKIGHAAMLLFSILVAGSFSLGVQIANLVEPAAINAFRFLIAAIVVFTFIVVSSKVKLSELKALKKAPWRFVLLGGTFATYFVMMFEGLKTAAPVSSSIIFTLIPIMAAIFGFVLLRQIITSRMGLALFVALLGAVWVIFRGDLSLLIAFDIGKGELIFFLGCVAHAIYIPMARVFNWGEKPIISTFGMMICSMAFLAAFGFNDILNTDWLSLPPIFWFTLFYISIFASATTFFLLQYATLVLPSGKVMAYNYLTPIWVILVEVAFGHDWPSSIIWFGVIAIIIALIMLLKDEAPT